ncbi:MAG: hypothetical protein QNJ44_13325 [Rhodobacter sp.]|nr:hypothetical protein [Rhodobacter sp.]
MSDRESLTVFRRARRHLADARHCDALSRASSSPSVRDSATAAYVRAVDALVADLARLEEMGVMTRIEAFLTASAPPQT